MYLSSEDKYVGSVKNFRIQLPREVNVEGQWEVSLAELYVDTAINSETFVCINIIEESVLGSGLKSILRRVHAGQHWTFNSEQFHKLTTNTIRDIKVYFIAGNIPFERVDFTLHFRKCSGQTGIRP